MRQGVNYLRIKIMKLPEQYLQEISPLADSTNQSPEEKKKMKRESAIALWFFPECVRVFQILTPVHHLSALRTRIRSFYRKSPGSFSSSLMAVRSAVGHGATIRGAATRPKEERNRQRKRNEERERDKKNDEKEKDTERQRQRERERER